MQDVLTAAMRMHRAGQLGPAAQLYQQVLAREQDNVDALHLLGVLCHQQGDHATAVRLIGRAVSLRPGVAAFHANLAAAYLATGQPDRAVDCCRAALSLQPNSARLHCYVGSVHERLEDYDEAVSRYKQALKLEPGYAEAHNRLGSARSEQGRLAEAREHFAAALQLRPDFHAARGALGQVLQELGDLEGSEREFRQILDRNPRHATALAALATLLRGRLREADRLLVERRLAERELPDAARSDLLFAVAAVRDADGDYTKAAEHLEQANALALARRNRLGQGYDPASHARTVDAMIAACTPEFFARVRGFGLETERPVFIVGLPRSGTTLTEQILAAHSQVCGAGELHWVRQSFLTLGDAPTDERAIEALARADREAIERTARRHLERLQGLNDTAARVVDKMPDNYLYLGFLAVLFPKAKFIHCRRDLRDVAVSCWSTNFRSTVWTSDPDHIAGRFELYLRVMDHWRAVLPVPVLEVDYEETVSDLEGVARRLVGWCGLEWEPGCLAFHEGKRPVRTASMAQVRQPVYRNAAGRWKNYEGVLAPLLRRVQDLITSRPVP